MRRKQLPFVPFNIRINNETFKHKTYSTFLGIYVDENLNWKGHVNLIANRVFKSIGIISKARFYLSMPSLRTLYFALVYPYLQYATTVWGSTYKTTLNRPLVLQKRIRRVNTKSCFDAPNSISDGLLLLTSPCLMRIIKRVQKSLKRFSWPSGGSWLVSLSYDCIWCVLFFWFPKVERGFCA